MLSSLSINCRTLELSKSCQAQHVPQSLVQPVHTLMPSSGFSCNSFSSLAIALTTAGGSGSAAYNASNIVGFGSIGVRNTGIDRSDRQSHERFQCQTKVRGPQTNTPEGLPFKTCSDAARPVHGHRGLGSEAPVHQSARVGKVPHNSCWCSTNTWVRCEVEEQVSMLPATCFSCKMLSKKLNPLEINGQSTYEYDAA